MTSHSPADSQEEVPEEYEQAWASILELTRSQGLSWSGGEENHLFLNLGDGRFADLSTISAADFGDDARAVSSLDWDGDGRLDLILRSRTAPRIRVMLNQTGAGQHLALRLRGVDCNRDAIGARVVVKVGERQLRRTLQAGDSFLAQGTKVLHFGLDEATEADEVRVLWPDGSEQRWTKLAAGGRYLLVQGQNQAQPDGRAQHAWLADAEATEFPRQGQAVVRIPLIEKIPLHHLPIPSWDNPDRTVADLGAGPVLINLWGVDCVNCLKEFGTFQKRAEAFERRGLRLVALNTDPPEQRERALAMLERFGLSEHAGVADARFLAVLEAILYEVLGTTPGSPLPTSLLLDAQGSLCVIYQGVVKMPDLLRDAETVLRLDPRRGSLHELHSGLRLVKRLRNWRFLARTFGEAGLVEAAAEFTRLAEAAGH